MPKPIDGSLVNIPVESKKVKGIGKSETLEIDVPTAATIVELIVKRHAWPDTGETVIHAQLWISYDSGKKYSLLIGFRADGGEFTDSHGVSYDSSRVTRHMKPQDKSHVRRVKVLFDQFTTLEVETQLEFW